MGTLRVGEEPMHESSTALEKKTCPLSIHPAHSPLHTFMWWPSKTLDCAASPKAVTAIMLPKPEWSYLCSQNSRCLVLLQGHPDSGIEIRILPYLEIQFKFHYITFKNSPLWLSYGPQPTMSSAEPLLSLSPMWSLSHGIVPGDLW